MALVLYFYDVVRGEYCFARSHVCVPVYVAPCFLVVPFSRLTCEVMVSYVVGLVSGRASWFMYWSHNGCIFVLYMR